MERSPFRNTRAVFAVWGAVLVLLLATGIAANVALAQYVRHMRESDPQTYLQEARRLLDRNDIAGAARQIEIALQKAPDNPEPYRQRGLLLFRLKHWQEAFDSFQESIRRGGHIEDTYLKSMNALMQMKRHEEAIAFGKESLGQGFSHWTFHWYMGEIYRALGRYAEAIPCYEHALQGHRNDPFIMDHLAQAYRSTGNAEKAEAVERQIAETQALQERLAQ